MKRILFFSVLFSMFFASCGNGEFDNIKELVSGEKIYPGKYKDNPQIRVGFQRVEIDLIEGRIPTEEISMGKAVTTVVEYDDERIDFGELRSWVNIPNLTRQKMYRFKIFTEDEYGNKSLPVEAQAIPYFEEDLKNLTVPEPRVILTSEGAQLSWPRELLGVSMTHLGMTYSYRDRDGDLIEGESGAFGTVMLQNVQTGDNVVVNLIHNVIPLVSSGPILDDVSVAQRVELIIPALSKKVNVALGKNTKTDSQRNANEGGSNAVNGTRTNDRWVSADNTNDHWIEIDLGGGYPIDGFAIFTGADATPGSPIANFEFQVWEVDQWVTVVSETTNANPSYSATFNKVTTSKVRLYTKGQAIRLFEIEIYLTVSQPDMRVNVALYRDFAVSDTRNSATEGGNQALNGRRGPSNSQGRWVTASGNHWIEVYLAGPTLIDGFGIWTGSDNYQQPLEVFRLMIWENGAWKTVHEYTSSNRNYVPELSVNFSPVTTDKIRLEIDNQEVRLFQLEVYSTVTLFD